MSIEIKYCEDCKWHRILSSGSHVCSNPKAAGITLVTREEWQFCRHERGEIGNCGIVAKNFELKAVSSKEKPMIEKRSLHDVLIDLCHWW